MERTILNKILGIMIILALVGTISAYDAHKQNTNYNLIISSNNATNCNVSYIQRADVIFNNIIPMTKNVNDFSKTLDKGNFSAIGDTCIGITCTDGTTIETGSKCLTVSPLGYNGLIGYYFIFIIIVWAIFLIGLWKKDESFAMLGIIGFYIVSLYILIFGIDGMKDWLTNGLGVIHLGVAFYTSIRFGIETLELNW